MKIKITKNFFKQTTEIEYSIQEVLMLNQPQNMEYKVFDFVKKSRTVSLN